jgi:hypothetical protein
MDAISQAHGRAGSPLDPFSTSGSALTAAAL